MQTEWRLFGLDLARAWQQAAAAGRSLIDNILHALEPQARVTVLEPGQQPNSGFCAVELPESLLLRRQLRLPPASAAHTRAAVATDIATHSPFSSHDGLWVYQVSATAGQRTVEWVLTSRPLVLQYLGQQQLDPGRVEARVMIDGHAHELPGFAEVRRRRRGRRFAFLNLSLLLAAGAWLTAIAVTPTLHKRVQAKQAEMALDSLTQQSRPVLQQREALLAATEQAQQLNTQLANGTPALAMLSALTQALPDDAQLRTLRLQGHQVQMSGQVSDAASLMKALGGQPGISEVRAPTAATRPPGATKEQFSIELTMVIPSSTTPPETPAATAATTSPSATTATTAANSPANPTAATTPPASAARATTSPP